MGRGTAPRINSGRPQFQAKFPYLPLYENQYTITPGRIDVFLGIPWGASAEEATKILLSSPDVEFDSVDSAPLLTNLIFSGGFFGSFNVSKYVLQFGAEGFFMGLVYLKPENYSTFFQLWNLVKTELTSRYGKPPIDRIEFDPPYYEGDGDEFDAFLAGKARIHCQWDFANRGGKLNSLFMYIEEPSTASINLGQVHTLLDIIVAYQNVAMYARVMQSIREVDPMIFKNLGIS